MKPPVSRSFRRESRLFLSVALLLILFLNFVTLLFFRQGVAWGSQQTERRAAEILRRVSLPAGDPFDTMERAALEPDVLFLASYDAAGRRTRSFGRELEAPLFLPQPRPARGLVLSEWKENPPLLLSLFGASKGFFAVALDPGAGSALRAYTRSLAVVLVLAGAALVVLAWLYLRGLLAPFERLLEAAGSAPGSGADSLPHRDERDFLIERFEATTAALSEKERELENLARAQMQRADDLEIAARTLARNLPTGLLSVDPAGAVIGLNEAGREILQISRDARGESFSQVLAGVPEFDALVAGVLSDHETRGRQEVRWPEDRDRVLGITLTPATGADGRFLGVFALFSDLSEIRRLEARVALARHLADIGEVSAGAAHEFRNAAAAIDGFADLALRHPDRAAEHLKAIRREAQEMARVTGDFLLFARPDRFVPEKVSLAAVAEAAAAETEAAFPGAAVARFGDFPEVPGSPVLLRRALVNLLRNAVEATPHGRWREADAIAVTSEKNDDEVSLSVADRGPGIDPAEREKVFLPFFSTKADGVGFGLAIVARISELHGGTVEVAARPGGGALLILRLPLSSRGARRPSSDVPAGSGDRPVRREAPDPPGPPPAPRSSS